jgi:hypothetical protein
MNKRKKLIKLTGHVGMLISLSSILGPIGFKAYLIVTTFSYHLNKYKENKIYIIEALPEKKETFFYSFDWRTSK